MYPYSPHQQEGDVSLYDIIKFSCSTLNLRFAYQFLTQQLCL